MKIELENELRPHVGPIYNLSRLELSEMKKQLDELLAKGLIRLRHRGSPVLFTKKRYGILRICIDYSAPNKQTIKNSVRIPEIDELRDQVGRARFFFCTNLRSDYHRIRTQKVHIETTVFRTRY